MSQIENLYQKFKQRNDKIIIIKGKSYYRILGSDFIKIAGRKKGILSVIPSPDMPMKYNSVYQDENGNHFINKGFQFIRFVDGKIPEWYIKCGICTMDWQETNDIGKYLSLYEEN